MEGRRDGRGPGLEQRLRGLQLTLFRECMDARLWAFVMGVVADESGLRVQGQAQEGPEGK